MAIVALTDFVGKPGPMGSLAFVLLQHRGMLERLCFLDNEYGDAARANWFLQRHVFPRVQAALERAGKTRTFRIYGIDVDRKKLHTIRVLYNCGEADAAIWSKPEYLHLSLYTPSDKARALARKADEAGEILDRGTPRRGGRPEATLTHLKTT